MLNLGRQESLLGTKEGKKKDSKVMEKHIKSVSNLLMKLHTDHVRNRDKVHDKLSKENERLIQVREYHAPNRRINLAIITLQSRKSSASKGNRWRCPSTSNP
jgi:hypothetical protein